MNSRRSYIKLIDCYIYLRIAKLMGVQYISENQWTIFLLCPMYLHDTVVVKVRRFKSSSVGNMKEETRPAQFGCLAMIVVLLSKRSEYLIRRIKLVCTELVEPSGVL